jgi:hypothetical protein
MLDCIVNGCLQRFWLIWKADEGCLEASAQDGQERYSEDLPRIQRLLVLAEAQCPQELLA